MIMEQRPNSGTAARSLYTANFQSNIFGPMNDQNNGLTAPSGKRRDQTTSEMFGSYNEKDLKSTPKTFVPKDGTLTARQKKMQFLSSEVLPCSKVEPPAIEPSPISPRQLPRPAFPDMEAPEQAVDTSLLRHEELKSKLFGRPTPQMESDTHAHRRLTPTDTAWHNHPEDVHHKGENLAHNRRAFQEKCSTIFDNRSPETLDDHMEAEKKAKEADCEGAQRRRTNVYYSDLFGRTAPSDSSAPLSSDRRCKHQGSSEDKLTVHQDWTDAKTELLSQASRPEHPILRKHEELHQARIFGPRSDDWQPSTDRPISMTEDNLQKTKISKSSERRPTQDIHQAHLRTSMTSDDFYKEAEQAKHWEVVELYLSGLAESVDEEFLRNKCQGFDLQIVKVFVDMDPVRNYCKGRAKVMVRFNPTRESVNALVQKLEALNFRVEI